MFRFVPVFVLSLILAIMFAACETPPEEIPEDLTRAEMVQQAQEAVDNEYWETALRYYKAIVERYPEDPSSQAEARYEIAFITYKRGEYEESVSLFRDLLTTYESDESGELPAWPRVLSDKMIVIIEEKMAADRPALTGDDSTEG